VDALRGLAASWVVVFHAFAAGHMAHLAPHLPPWLVRVILRGDLAVAVFFVLSGFVIAHTIGQVRVDGRYALRFVVRRRLRLDPPYLASIALVIIVTHLLRGGPPLAPDPTAGGLLAHALYLQDVLHVPALSPVYWTLCLEIQFYVVLVVLLVVADHFRSGADAWRWRNVLLFATAVVPLALLVQLIELRWPGLFLGQWHIFLAGVLAAWALGGTLSRRWFYLYAALLATAAAPVQSRFTQTAVLTAVLLLEVGRADRLGRWLGWRPLQLLGTISYSLYLVHTPVTAFVSAHTLFRLTPRTPAWEACWLVVFVAASYAFAFAFHYAIERPAMRWSHHVGLRRPIAPAVGSRLP
jgi:peptidoglycan/LPS O-acetylase OafA/YrhL